jgi:hypothetical protein
MKRAVLFSTAILLGFSVASFAGYVEDQLRGKGLHVADLTDNDMVNLQINRFQQAIQQQWIADIENILSVNYTENDSTFTHQSVGEQLELIFSALSQLRGLPTQTNPETGWRFTSTYDFFLRKTNISTQGNQAEAQCEIGLLFAGRDYWGIKDTLRFARAQDVWLLEGARRLFGFLKEASLSLQQAPATTGVTGHAMATGKGDFVSDNLLVPTTLCSFGKTTLARWTRSESINQFGFNCMNLPYGIVADVEICQGGPDFNHEYLFVGDPIASKILGSDQDDWVGEFGSKGAGIGQFYEPHGICTIEGYTYFVADTYNDRVVAYEYYNQLDEPQWVDDLTLYCYFNKPRDVEAKEKMPDSLQQKSYIAIADAGNHRIVIFRWEPYFGWDRNYGERGSGQGQFIWPSSVCFGREPNWGWHTNDLFICDRHNYRLARVYIAPENTIWRSSYQFADDVDLTSVDVDNKGLVYVLDRRNGKVYKFSPLKDLPYTFTLLGIWGQTGTQDGQLYYPNAIQVAHGRYVPYPAPWIPLNGLGDVFISESWGDQTGVRRFVIAADVLNLTAEWVPFNESTGQGNFIWWQYHLTDCGTVTEQVLRGGEVCTTYNEGTLNWGNQAGSWPVAGHPHGTYYTVKITAGSIYDPGIVVEKTVDVYVDTLSTHDPVITQGIRCHWVNEPFTPCDNCGHCIKENEGYIIDVQAAHPNGYPLTYEWQCGRGYFWNIGDDDICNPCITDTNSICYVAPEAPADKEGPGYEFMLVLVRDPYGGEAEAGIYTNDIFDSEYSCLCGDADGNSIVDLGDAVYIQNYLFRGFDPPPDPIERADANNDCVVDMADVIYMLNYLFKYDSPPECCWLHE